MIHDNHYHSCNQDHNIKNYYIGSNKIEQPTTWAFIPDKTPCQAVVKYELPAGISYKEGII